MSVSATNVYISIFAVLRTDWFSLDCFLNYERTPNTSSDGRSPLGNIMCLMALILISNICLSCNDLCYVLKMLNNL